MTGSGFAFDCDFPSREFDRETFWTAMRALSSEERTIDGTPKLGIGLIGLDDERIDGVAVVRDGVGDKERVGDRDGIVSGRCCRF